MMESRKISALLTGTLLTLFIVMIPFSSVSYAADNDDFLVTMSGAYLECNIVNGSWNIGTVQMSGSNWTNASAQKAVSETQTADTYNSTAGTNLDFEMDIATDAATWKTAWLENLTTGADLYHLNATSDSWATQAGLNISVFIDVDSNFDPQANVSFDMRFDSPTSTTVGAQQIITTNGKVTIH